MRGILDSHIPSCHPRLSTTKIHPPQFSGLDESSGAIVDQPGPGVQHVSGYPFLDNHAINLVRWIMFHFPSFCCYHVHFVGKKSPSQLPAIFSSKRRANWGKFVPLPLSPKRKKRQSRPTFRERQEAKLRQ